MKQPDIRKIDLLLQYVLAVAGLEDGWERELGMIHLIKYVYLADLAYAEQNDGETFTGVPWRFHHFGPWAEDVYFRIEPALEAIGAQKKAITNPKDDKDFFRWSIQDDNLIERLEKQIDLCVSGCVQRAVRRFGSDTKSLLHFVYRTGPVLRAAPEEYLDFTPSDSTSADSEQMEITDSFKPLTARQKKKRKEKLLALKKRIAERLDLELGKMEIPPTPPRYDDVFFEGVGHLDSLAGEPLSPVDLTVSVSDDMWKSKARFDPDVS